MGTTSSVPLEAFLQDAGGGSLQAEIFSFPLLDDVILWRDGYYVIIINIHHGLGNLYKCPSLPHIHLGLNRKVSVP